MSSYKELLAQREKLEKQIEEAKAREYAQVLDEIKQKMADYGITLTELGGSRAGGKNAKVSRSRASVAPNIGIRTAAARGRVAASRPAGSPARIGKSF